MPLETGLVELQLDTLYRVSLNRNTNDQGAPNIEVVGGTVDIYGSQTEPESPPTGMSLAQSDFEGITSFGVIPHYLYIEEASGDVSSIIVSGLKVDEVE